MSQERKPVVAPDPFGALAQIVRTVRLAWRLTLDPRVPTFPKIIIPAAIIYVLSPIDLLPDFILGLGQLDDIAVLIFSVRFFIEMCPPDIVEEHRRAIAISKARSGEAQENIVEGSYRVMSDDDQP